MDRRVVDERAAKALRQAWPEILAVLQVVSLAVIIAVLYWIATTQWLVIFAMPQVVLWGLLLAVFAGGMAFGRWYWSDAETDR